MSSPWQEARAADGRVYYYNTLTKATQWTKPEEMMSAAEVCWPVPATRARTSADRDEQRALQDLPWKEHKAADGRPYWYVSAVFLRPLDLLLMVIK